MLYQLQPESYHIVRPLLETLDYNLCLASLLAGRSSGRIFCDNPAHPSAVLVEMGHHLFLAGRPENQDFIQGARQLIEQVLVPRGRAAGRDVFMLHIDSDGWETPARNILSGFFPLDRTRQYFECTSVKEDWRGLLPEGYRLAAVDEQLTKQGQLANIDYLLEELSSERASVSDFLNHSFGFAILHQNDLAAWCLSEYNLSGRCEVGVATVDAYQRRGLGTVASLALVEHALVQGYSRVGWHCWKWNLASSALARRSGFAHTRDYPVFFCILNRAVQFAFHGNDARAGGDDHAAVSWYRRSISAPEGAPAWAFYGFARSLARLNQPGSALDALRQAVARGYNDFRSASQEPDLKELRKLPEWNTIIPRNLSNELEMTL